MPPQIIQFPEDQKVRAGEPVELFGKVAGTQPITCTWMKFRKQVSHGSHARWPKDNAQPLGLKDDWHWVARGLCSALLWKWRRALGTVGQTRNPSTWKRMARSRAAQPNKFQDPVQIKHRPGYGLMDSQHPKTQLLKK